MKFYSLRVCVFPTYVIDIIRVLQYSLLSQPMMGGYIDTYCEIPTNEGFFFSLFVCLPFFLK